MECYWAGLASEVSKGCILKLQSLLVLQWETNMFLSNVQFHKVMIMFDAISAICMSESAMSPRGSSMHFVC